MEEISRLVDDVNFVKRKLEEWRQELPDYYEAIPLPVIPSELDDQDIMVDFPYDSHIVYLAGIISESSILT